MDQMVYGSACFDRAAELLPREMRYAVAKLPLEQRAVAEEFRLRAGRGLSVQGPAGEYLVTNGQGLLVYQSDLRQVLEIATQASAHSALEQVKNGFFTVRNGHRIGLCGTAVVKDGEITNLKDFSSLAIRIAKEVPGICFPVVEELMEDGRFCNTLIVSPPGGGKTTFLRDLIRTLSDGTADGSIPALRVGLADERGEVAAMYCGLPQMNVGLHTDILDGCPKSDGMLLLLRSMNPQVLAADEITAPEDCDALEMAANCGVSLVATAHCADREELERRPMYRNLLISGVFSRLVIIRVENGKRVCSVERLSPVQKKPVRVRYIQKQSGKTRREKILRAHLVPSDSQRGFSGVPGNARFENSETQETESAEQRADNGDSFSGEIKAAAPQEDAVLEEQKGPAPESSSGTSCSGSSENGDLCSG
ncbi:MAG: stage III sporulation protein AB [Oscillospiraceae bacterium]|nr:stage III sporulation protein AB [Oscillospiraceae bacterium]